MAFELSDIDIALREPAFDALVEHHRKELQVHCYRMLAAANDIRAPGENDYARLSLDVLRIEDEPFSEIITFPESVFDDNGLRSNSDPRDSPLPQYLLPQ